MLCVRRLAVFVVACFALSAVAPSAEAGLLFRRKMPVVSEPVVPGPTLTSPLLSEPAWSEPATPTTTEVLPPIFGDQTVTRYSPAPASFATSTVMPADFIAPACCATARISYRHTGLFKVKSCTKVTMNLVAVNPCTRCPVCVPVCLPACCDMCPVVSCRKALFGDGVVTYAWASGVSVNIRFQRTGNVLVTYHRA